MKPMSENRRNYTNMDFVKKTHRNAPTPVPAKRVEPKIDHDGIAVKKAIAAAAEEKRAKLAAEAAHKANQRRILAQVAGIPESEVDEQQ
jgi:hypothetical protein